MVVDSLGAELERLAHLHASGHLSDDEYEALKERLLESTLSTVHSETVAGDSVDWVKGKAAEATAWIEEKWSDPDLLAKGGELVGKGQKIGKRGRFTGAGQLLLGASNVASNLIERRKHELLAGVSEEAATSVAKPQGTWVPDAVSGESRDEADARPHKGRGQ